MDRRCSVSELAEAVSELLMHDFRTTVVVTMEDGATGVALMLDGWYSPNADELGMGPTSTLGFWQHLLNRVLDALAEEKSAA
jgi:hypothetical protein